MTRASRAVTDPSVNFAVPMGIAEGHDVKNSVVVRRLDHNFGSSGNQRRE